MELSNSFILGLVLANRTISLISAALRHRFDQSAAGGGGEPSLVRRIIRVQDIYGRSLPYRTCSLPNGLKLRRPSIVIRSAAVAGGLPALSAAKTRRVSLTLRDIASQCWNRSGNSR